MMNNKKVIAKNFITSKLKTQLPLWFRCMRAQQRTVVIVMTHFTAKEKEAEVEPPIEEVQTKAIVHENDEHEGEEDDNYFILKSEIEKIIITSSAYNPRSIALCMGKELMTRVGKLSGSIGDLAPVGGLTNEQIEQTKRIIQNLTLTKLINLEKPSTAAEVPSYILGFILDYIITHTHFHNKITKGELQALASDATNEILRIFENTSTEEIEATFIELYESYSHSNLQNAYEIYKDEAQVPQTQHTDRNYYDEYDFVLGAYEILSDYKHELDKFAEMICQFGKFEECVSIYIDERTNYDANDAHTYRDVATCLAMVFQSELGIDLGYTGSYFSFSYSDEQIVGRQSAIIEVLNKNNCFNLSELSVWKLNAVCKELSIRFPYEIPYIYINLQRNIIKMIKLIYPTSDVIVKHGVIGGVHPMIENLIYDVSKTTTTATEGEPFDDEVDAFFDKLFTKKLIYNRVNRKMRDLAKLLSNQDLVQRVCLEALTKINGGIKPEVLENNNQDTAKQIGKIVAETQTSLVRAISNSISTPHVSVYSNLAVMNSEYGDESVNCFTCYANESGMPKKFVIDGQLDFVEFWLYDGDRQRIKEEDIKEFRVEMMLEAISGD